MNRRIVWLSFLVAVVMFSTAVHAQQPRQGQRGRGFRGFGMSLAQVVSNRAVQKELALTEEQRGKLREAAAELRGPRTDRESRQNLSDEERRALRTKRGEAAQNLSDEERQALTAKREEAAKKLEAKLAEILKPNQLTRAKEIRLRAAGITGALRDPEVVKALGITEEQQEKINNAAREVMQGLRSAGGERPNFAELRRKVDAKIKEQIEELLSDEQNAELKKMLGPPFDVSQLRAGQRGLGLGRGRRTDN